MNATTYGLDVAKSVMQVYWVEGETGEIGQRTAEAHAAGGVFCATRTRAGRARGVRQRVTLGRARSRVWATR